MISLYIIEVWNTKTKKYETYWTGHSIERAEILMNKPYFVRHTRRLIRIDTDLLYRIKKGKYLTNG
jgi:hypothetical protein